MIRCLICNQSYSRRDALQRHERDVHGSGKYTDQSQPLKKMTFRHPFSMMVTGPSGSAKTFKNQHDMNQADSIRQAIKLRKDLFMDVWPNHNIETEKASKDQEDSITS